MKESCNDQSMFLIFSIFIAMVIGGVFQPMELILLTASVCPVAMNSKKSTLTWIWAILCVALRIKI